MLGILNALIDYDESDNKTKDKEQSAFGKFIQRNLNLIKEYKIDNVVPQELVNTLIKDIKSVIAIDNSSKEIKEVKREVLSATLSNGTILSFSELEINNFRAMEEKELNDYFYSKGYSSEDINKILKEIIC